MHPLSAGTIDKIEAEAVRMVNNIMAKYNSLQIDEHGFEEGKLNFKGTIPDEVKIQQ